MCIWENNEKRNDFFLTCKVSTILKPPKKYKNVVSPLFSLSNVNDTFFPIFNDFLFGACSNYNIFLCAVYCVIFKSLVFFLFFSSISPFFGRIFSHFCQKSSSGGWEKPRSPFSRLLINICIFLFKSYIFFCCLRWWQGKRWKKYKGWTCEYVIEKKMEEKKKWRQKKNSIYFLLLLFNSFLLSLHRGNIWKYLFTCEFAGRNLITWNLENLHIMRIANICEMWKHYKNLHRYYSDVSHIHEQQGIKYIYFKMKGFSVLSLIFLLLFENEKTSKNLKFREENGEITLQLLHSILSGEEFFFANFFH